MARALKKPPDSGDLGGGGRGKGACQSRSPPGDGASLQARPGPGAAVPGLERAAQPQASSGPPSGEAPVIGIIRGMSGKERDPGEQQDSSMECDPS